MLQTNLGSSRVLARPGDWRLSLLNPAAAILWDLHASGLDSQAIADVLARQFGLAPQTARLQTDQLIEQWREGGLLGTPPASPAPAPDGPEPPAVRPPAASLRPGDVPLAVAGIPILLGVDDETLAWALTPVVAPLQRQAPSMHAHRLHLAGGCAHWQLWLDGHLCAMGEGVDDAVVMTMGALIGIGCRGEERLFVIHGAGLALDHQRGLLLIAPGGSGKTTLAAALNAQGYALLGDDVIPVTPDGNLVGLGTPLCIKAGSWPVLAAYRPDLAVTAAVQRYGQSVRYLPPRGLGVTRPVRPTLLLFPRYQPDRAPHVAALTPPAVLQGLVEAQAVIRHLTQEKLEAIARWVGSAQAYALTYPDLDSALALVHHLLDDGP